MAETMECEQDYCKVFGNIQILWNIEHFSLVNCEKGFEVESPEFGVNGPAITRWKLVFTPECEETSSMVLCVHRLDDSGPTVVHVNWSLVMKVMGDKCCEHEYVNTIEKNHPIRVYIQNFSDVLSRMKSFGCDTLMLRVHLIIQHKDKSISLPQPSKGLQSLSEDLGAMFSSSKLKDADKITIKVENKDIIAHKAIVRRNAFFEERIRDASEDKIELKGLTFIAVKNFIEFLYTGNLSKILQNPTIGMFNCLDEMDEDLLRCYFSSEQLNVNTILRVEEIEHLWQIPHFSTKKQNFLKSPVFKKSDADIEWQLYFYPNEGDDSDHMSVEAVIVEGKEPPNLCLEFGIEDQEGEVLYPSKVLSSNGKCNMKVKEFVKKDCVSELLSTSNDTLNLLFKAGTWDGHVHSRTGSRMFSIVTYGTKSPYKQLSDYMQSLFQSGTYSDVSIKASDLAMKAHRCILSVRSSYFRCQPKTSELVVEGIASPVLRKLLQYIYTGECRDLTEEEKDSMLEAAQTLGVSSFIKEYKDSENELEKMSICETEIKEYRKEQDTESSPGKDTTTSSE